MRITNAMSLNTVLQSESLVSQRLATLQQQAATGLRVSEPSDDPAAYASIVQQTAQISTIQARISAASLAGGNLDLAGNVLDQATTLLQQAQSIAVEQANGTQDANSRANAASQVNSILQQLQAIANTRGSSGYLFGGTHNASPPFDAAGNYSGNTGVTHVEIADGVQAVSNANGLQAFNAPGGRNVFADLQTFATALSSNDTTTIQASITNLQGSHDQMVAAEVNTGELADRLHSAGNVMSGALTQMQTSLASVADADAASTLSNLQQTQTSFQAALQVNRQILSLAASQVSG